MKKLIEEVKSRLNDKSFMISLSLSPKLKSKIEEYTSWMNDFYVKLPLKIRCLAIHLGYNEYTFPRCSECGNPVSYDKEYGKRFNQFCSDSCSKASGRLTQEQRLKLDDYSWLYQKRMVEKLSFDDIALELNCSITPVKKAIKSHKLPDVKYNESNSLTLSNLRNKEWLIEQHQIMHRTLDDIAEEINSSSATVSRWLQYHGIIANSPNSYDRDNNFTSKQSLEVYDFLTSLGVKLQKNNRTLLNGVELDFVDHERKIAIEYNGLYSHVFRPNETVYSLRKDSTYHLSKTIKSESVGINYFTFSVMIGYRRKIYGNQY